jgi:hypothetical protein
VKPRIVIRQERPWLRWVLAAAILAVLAMLAGGSWWLYRSARSVSATAVEHGRDRIDQLQARNSDLAGQLKKADAQVASLEDRLAYVRNSNTIDGDACKLVQKSLAGLQQENSSLREQLAFYRGIASPQASSQGLRVYDLRVHDEGSDRYGYDVLLVQVLHHDQRVSGSVDVTFEGIENGKHRSYPLSKLVSGDHTAPTRFSFKYFQELDGHFSLPKGFRPLRVDVVLHPEGGRAAVEEHYDWSKIERSQKGAS